MTDSSSLQMAEVPKEGRAPLLGILEQSFEGWYLRHSIQRLWQSELVLATLREERPVGLLMLDRLDPKTGYIFYVAVDSSNRKKGVASSLLDTAILRLKSSGCIRVFASVEKENKPSLSLFTSKGFIPTHFRHMSKLFGRLGALNMYRRMVVVPGELLLVKEIGDERV
jgi:ribosomal protein S18 acetylase RimI-like enzyme